MHAEWRQHLVHPRVGRDDERPAPVGAGRGLQRETIAVGADPFDPRVGEEIGASREREAPMHRVGPTGRHDPRIALVDGEDLVGDVPRGPALDERGSIQDLVLHAFLAHRLQEGFGLIGRIAREEVEAPGHGHELFARLLGHLRPCLEGLLREPNVVGRRVAPPDDPRVILGCASCVPELEPFEPDHACAPPRGPVRGRRAEGAETDDAEIVSVVGTAQRGALTSPRRSRRR